MACMLRVIGEIGGTSSRWAVIGGDGGPGILSPKGVHWPGYNPVSGDGRAFAQQLQENFQDTFVEALSADRVWVYGAGCGSEDRKARMHQALRNVWPDAELQVESDLMGAALGLSAGSSGLVLILGTGMNVGYYDGARLHTPMPSLGYLLGDEGSGADIGKHMLQDTFHGRMPAEVVDLVYGGDVPLVSTAIRAIHAADHPARELARYTALLAPHLELPYVRELISDRFVAMTDLVSHYFPPEQAAVVRATGSVAYGFQDLLADRLLDRGMVLTAVEPDPLPGLVRHHQPPSGR